MSSVGERLKAFREKLGVKQKEFAELCAKADKREDVKWGQSRIANYETNSRTPSLEDIAIISQVLGIEPAVLAFSTDEIEVVGRPKEGVVAVVGQATMGREDRIYLEEMHTGYVRIFSQDPQAYCLSVRGSSMEPRIHSGEYVLIEPSVRVCNGDDVLVRTVDGQYMIKILEYKRDGEYRFSSINHDHKPFNLQENEVECVHAVSAILKQSRFISFEEINDED
ncbi:LexA family transcriptional regulator [Haemophilus paraphrohaemolyticus]|uniref:Peptidase S24-like protein n=1 Tax=Haemophilus paraphrohaemolyticus HK411 TaxID=1095743 RepID=I2NCT0_9PAST|nr:XRE family transcriptional regulator [Haemophilus paraphrohaemolyticus]EIG23641.1 peptidase S24-like protein [Haemophilus paraphrohaemolyticus HK411]OOR93258.1 LexA family transcriptional repressor [Haemophilus paraphrohaemolyticus]STP02057.1 LexA repressor [Haemophilus paraphrohaemolyticus]DAX94381.1 MAG TPA: putative transcriptional regulator [Bacteriophage sp.]